MERGKDDEESTAALDDSLEVASLLVEFIPRRSYPLWGQGWRFGRSHPRKSDDRILVTIEDDRITVDVEET